MERKEIEMLEKHEKQLQQHKTEIESLKKEQLAQREIVQELKWGVREITGTVSGLVDSVGSLKRTIETDGASTRKYFEEAFSFIMRNRDKEAESRSQMMLAQLNTKEKVILGVISLLGSSGFVLGIAALFK